MKLPFPRRFKAWLVALVSLTAVAVVSIAPMMRPRAQSSTTYTFTDLGTLGGTYSRALGINNCGQVVGESSLTGTDPKRPFVWRDLNGNLVSDPGEMKDLGSLGGVRGSAADINAYGLVVGTSTILNGDERAFRWFDLDGDGTPDSGEMIDLGVLPNHSTHGAYGVNDNGQIVGSAEESLVTSGFIWNANTGLQILATHNGIQPSHGYAINNSSNIAGHAATLNHAFVFNGTTNIDLDTFGGPRSIAYDINATGHAVGFADVDDSSASPPSHAFKWNGTLPLQDLGVLTGGLRSQANSINSSGTVVGYSEVTGGARHAFVHYENQMYDLNALLDSSLPPGWTSLDEAHGINDGGQIVGYGTTSGGETRAFLLTPTTFTPGCSPTVTVTVSPASVSEDGATNLTYTFTRAPVTNTPLTVSFSTSGSATRAVDYAVSGTGITYDPGTGSGTVAFAAGEITKNVIVDPEADSAVETDETVVLTTTAGAGYIVGTPTSATGTINNDDLANVSVAVAPPSANEDGGTDLVYTFTRNSTIGSLTVNFSVGGNAEPTDYVQTGAASFTPPTGTVTFANGSPTATVTVNPSTDATVESDETVILTVTSGSGYTVGSPTGATGTITNDDTDVIVTLAPTSVTENGTPNLVYTFTRTGVTTGALTVNFFVGGTAVFGDDYTQTGAVTYSASAGTVTLSAGSSSATVTLDPTADTTVESDETVILTITAGAGYTVGSPSSATGTITNDDVAMTVQLGQSTFTVVEDSQVATITVTRSGDTSSAATVKYSTSDMAGLQSCTIANTMASERCDYTTAVGTVTFAPTESSKTFTVPIVNDVWVEGNETFFVNLSNPVGASLGSQATSTVEINDNDFATPTSNPIFGVEYFIRALYRDILNRQPDSTGLQNWIDTLTPCPNGGFGEPPTSNCDRLHIAAGFFQSDEYLNRGYWAFRFYMVSFNERPTYAQFIPDLSEVGGPKSPAEEETAKVAYADAFVQRPTFIALYGGLSGQALADALTQKTGLPQFTVPGGMTNGQILRAIAERQTSLDKFLTEGTVSILYFGFQRRDPDAVGYQNNVDTLNANPNNLRHMIFIFIYSTEYLNRFGPQ